MNQDVNGDNGLRDHRYPFRPTVTVLVPMYNEAANLQVLVNRWSSRFRDEKLDAELLLVDDGSTDETKVLADALAKAHPTWLRVVGYEPNRGRGFALRFGFALSRGAFICTFDADGSYGSELLKPMLNALQDEGGADIVLASPYMPGGATEGVPPFRLFLSRAGNVVLRSTLFPTLHTVTGVCRGYRRDAIRSLPLTAEDKTLHLEILERAMDVRLRVREIPATLRSREHGTSTFRLLPTVISHLRFIVIARWRTVGALAASAVALLLSVSAWKGGKTFTQSVGCMVPALLLIATFVWSERRRRTRVCDAVRDALAEAGK